MINTPDGTQVSEIILPDGSSATRVFDPNGNRVFGETAIPDSAVYRYKLDDVASGSVSDSVGTAPDGTVNGVTSISGNYTGGSAGETSGADGDHIDLNSTLPDFESNIESGFALGFTIDNASLQAVFTEVFGIANANFSDVFRFGFNEPDAPSSDSIGFRLQKSGNFIRGYSEPSGVFDGSKHRVLIGLSVSNATGECFIDNSNNGFTFSLSETTSWTSPNVDYYLFNSNVAGSTVDPSPDAVIDDFIIYDKLPDNSLAQADYDLQPWT